jgi:formamidopyrimidine-DNA glycosylase
VVFHLEPADLTLVVHPMLAGRFRLSTRTDADTRDLVVAFSGLDGAELRILDDVRMGKVYLMPTAKLSAIPGFEPVGMDVLGSSFSRAALASLLKKRRDQVKLFLLDKGAVDAFGNAYADEVLFAAGIHPKRRCSELSPSDIERLAVAMPKVLREARDEVERRAPPLDEKVRDFLHVRKRAGEPCPVCGAKIRTAGVRGQDAFFCPNCQPDVGGKGLVDWRGVTGPTR